MVAVVQALSMCVYTTTGEGGGESTCLRDAVVKLTNTTVLQTSLFKNGMAISPQGETEEKMPSATIMFI